MNIPDEAAFMNQATDIATLYRHYMREQGIGLFRLAQRLNNAWRRRGQKPRIWKRPRALAVNGSAEYPPAQQ